MNDAIIKENEKEDYKIVVALLYRTTNINLYAYLFLLGKRNVKPYNRRVRQYGSFLTPYRTSGVLIDLILLLTLLDLI